MLAMCYVVKVAPSTRRMQPVGSKSMFNSFNISEEV